MIATGAQGEVHVWEWHPVGKSQFLVRGEQSHLMIFLESWRLMVALAEPQKSAENLLKEVLVVGLHWMAFEGHPSVLAVSYRHHGIL